MLAKNIDVYRGLVNGARGVVRQFEPGSKGNHLSLDILALLLMIISMSSLLGHPVVRFTSGLEVAIGLEKWSVRTGGGNVATRRQLPLKLAWAISIHKSQVWQLWHYTDNVALYLEWAVVATLTALLGNFYVNFR